MKRTKPPALTSPSKIGFFVSLMLVFVSVGVSYFFINEFEVSWNWLDRNEWLGVIKGEGFLFDVLPLLAIVALSSLISYVVITGAVRKYKRYLDSGLDYKHLLSALKDIDTLEEKSKIDNLKNHPELRRLLLGISESLAQRKRELDEHQVNLEREAAEAVNVREEELTREFSRQCDRLVDAITSGAGSRLEADCDISDPGLKRIGEVIQSTVEAAPTPGVSELANSYGDLRKTSDVLQARLHEIASEMTESSTAAKEIEERIKQLAGADVRDSDRNRLESARDEVHKILGQFKSLEELANSLEVLSEEAKGIAISTALQAGSGEGTQDDLIRLAEDVREVAGRFKDATRRFSDVSVKMRPAMGALETFVGGEVDPRGGASSLEQSLVALGTKASLWVERVVVLSDKICNLWESYDVSVTGLPGAVPEEIFETTESTQQTSEASAEPEMPDESDEFGFETLDRTRSIFAGSPDPEVTTDGGAVETSDEGIFEGTSSQRKLFTDLSGEEQETPDKPAQSDDSPLDMPGFETFSRGAAFKPIQDSDTPLETDRFGRLRPGAQKPEVDGAPLRDTPGSPPVDRRDVPTADGRDLPPADGMGQTEEQEEVTDLYALGAVDYDPAVHG